MCFVILLGAAQRFASLNPVARGSRGPGLDRLCGNIAVRWATQSKPEQQINPSPKGGTIVAQRVSAGASRGLWVRAPSGAAPLADGNAVGASIHPEIHLNLFDGRNRFPLVSGRCECPLLYAFVGCLIETVTRGFLDSDIGWLALFRYHKPHENCAFQS